MKEPLLDLKCRSMKYNLVFTGLKETSYENTEENLRFGPITPENENMRRKFYQIHRPIVARFIYHRDLAYVLENAKKLKGKPFTINQQFPLEVENKRNDYIQ